MGLIPLIIKNYMQHNINSIYHHNYLVDAGENVPKEEEAFKKLRMSGFGRVVILGRFVNDQPNQSIN